MAAARLDRGADPLVGEVGGSRSSTIARSALWALDPRSLAGWRGDLQLAVERRDAAPQPVEPAAGGEFGPAQTFGRVWR
jgi:hypothetical protein